MVVCFRCGKSLSTPQMLEYHLRKKFDCRNRCKICDITYESKKGYRNHAMECSVNFDIDNLVFIIGGVQGDKDATTFLLDDTNGYKVVSRDEGVKLGVDVDVGECYFKNVRKEDVKRCEYMIENACGFSGTECEFIREGKGEYECKVKIVIICYAMYEYVIAIETQRKAKEKAKAEGIRTETERVLVRDFRRSII